MKEYWKKFKEFRRDPKKKSISLLIIYGIFFILVFIYIRSGQRVDYPIDNNQNISSNKQEVTNYEYNYEFNINNEVISINGIYYDGEDKFELNNNYDIRDNIIYINDSDININLNNVVKFFNYDSINKFISNYEYESKTEYKDNNIKYEYVISNEELVKYFDLENNNIGNSTIVIYENNYVYQIDIDLSEFYNVDNYKIILKYNNINNINSIKYNN